MHWLARQLLRLGVVLFCVTLLTYLIVNILPGDVAIVILGSLATPQDIAGLRADLGLDRPMLVRYFDWLGSALSGDLGRSYRNGEPVAQAIADRLPGSLQLMVMAQLIALGIAVPVALLSVRRPGGVFDRFSASTAFGFLAMPNFMLGIVLIYLFSVTFDLLPATGFTPMSEGLWDNIVSMTLPALTLGLIEWTVLMRVLRSDLLTTLKEDFILLARAKGLPPWRVLPSRYGRASARRTLATLTLRRSRGAKAPMMRWPVRHSSAPPARMSQHRCSPSRQWRCCAPCNRRWRVSRGWNRWRRMLSPARSAMFSAAG